MKDLQASLAALGFRCPRRTPQCWRVSRVDVPMPAARRARREPAESRALMHWLDHLADCRRPSPYRITPLDRGRVPGQPAGRADRPERGD